MKKLWTLLIELEQAKSGNSPFFNIKLIESNLRDTARTVRARSLRYAFHALGSPR